MPRKALKDYSLTDEAFEKRLVLFDPDLDIAAIRYEETHRRLCKYFECNGVNDPDDLVDETFARAARRIGEGIDIRNLNAYLASIARLVLIEYRVSRESKTEGIEGEIAVLGTEALVDEEDADDLQARERYAELIDKKFTTSLSSDEQKELSRLEKLMDETEAPLYEQTIERLKEIRDKLSSDPSSQ
ncbi:MAG: hypothetical protein L0229_18075 [Blastocatellia bacterium]|nr:hypothetical protein [Blastocatellia bacterium]